MKNAKITMENWKRQSIYANKCSLSGQRLEDVWTISRKIQAQRNRPNKDKSGNTTQDPEAHWNVKQGPDGKRTSTYGFKAHTSLDDDVFIKATASLRAMCRGLALECTTRYYAYIGTDLRLRQQDEYY